MKYDVVVVGAGSAGAVVAARLAMAGGRSVLLIEAGPDYPDFATLPDELKYGYAGGADVMVGEEHSWHFTGTANESAEPMLVPRGRVTGGTSAINGQVFLRGLPEDFDGWADRGNPEWSFEKVLPFFRRLETDMDFADDFHGVNGPVPCRRLRESEWIPPLRAFHQACVEAGHRPVADLNHPEASGVGPLPLNNPNNIRMSTALTYLVRVRHMLNLTVRPGCTVHRLIVERGRVTGLEVESGGERFVVEADHTVLSAGTIGSPHILMLSGIGPEEHLREMGIPVVHSLKGVGENLRDHPMSFVTARVRDLSSLDPMGPRLGVALRYSSGSSPHPNDMIMWMQAFATERAVRGGDRMTPIGIRIVVSVYLATSRGRVRLSSPDPDVQPELLYNLLQTDDDLARMRAGIRSACALFESPAFAEIVERRLEPLDSDLESDESLDLWLRREVTTAQHITGTCRMGPDSDPWAVVDQYGRLHGLEGLTVADASIIPDSVRANTNVTTMMIGERIADFLLDRV